MKSTQLFILAALLASVVSIEPANAQAFAAPTNMSLAGAGDTPDSGPYAKGTRAIDAGHWADAVRIFSGIAAQHGAHADGALYWQAYAENKLGQSDQAMKTCASLRQAYPSSRWIDECGALEIEIRSRSGAPVQPQSQQSDDVKLLALNSMMRQDELRAVAEIQQFLNGDQSETIKERALYILAQEQSKAARDLLASVAHQPANPALQARAAALLQNPAGPQTPAAYLAKSNPDGTIALDVQVTDKAGNPVSGLQAQDFKLYVDKNLTNPISFHAIGSGAERPDAPTEAILVIDAINAPFSVIANERQWLQNFFQSNGGEIPVPTSIAILTDKGISMQTHSTRDGKSLQAFLDNNVSGLRVINNSQGFYGGEERTDLSLKALDGLAAVAGRRPGRKLIIWIGPGWPVYAHLSWQMTNRDERSLFAYITEISTALREAGITLYTIDPTGVGPGQFFYQQFLKGVRDAKHADYGDLSVHVISTQSGGRVLFSNNDIGAQIAECIADARAYYVLTFRPSSAEHPNEYHDLHVDVDKPGLKVRTRTGFYQQP